MFPRKSYLCFITEVYTWYKWLIIAVPIFFGPLFFSTSHFLMPIFQEKFPFIQKSSRTLVRHTYTKIMKQEKIAVWNVFFLYICIPHMESFLIFFWAKSIFYITTWTLSCLDWRCVVFHRSVMSTTSWEWPCTYHPSGETYSSWSLERCSSWTSVTQKVIQWKLQVLLSEKKNCNDKSLCVMLFRSVLLGQILRTQSTQLWRTCRPSTRKRRDCLTWYQHHTFSDPVDCVSFAKMFYWFPALQYIQHTHTHSSY